MPRSLLYRRLRSLLPRMADRHAWPSPLRAQHAASELPAVCAVVLPPPGFALALQKLVSERHECFTAKVWTCPCVLLPHWNLQLRLSHVPAIGPARAFWILISCWTCCSPGLRASLGSHRTFSSELFIKRYNIEITWSFCFSVKADPFPMASPSRAA